MPTITLTPAQVTAIKNAIAGVDALLTFAANLSEQQRHDLYKLGTKLDIVMQTRDGVANNPTAFPPSFDAAGFLAEVDTFNTLTELTQIVDGVRRKLDDTRISVGADCMKGVSVARTYIDTAAKTTPGLQALSAQLAAHFKRASQAKPAAKTA